MNQRLVWPRRAVIDIGSNSVRLVIFAGPPRVPVTILNEKALCGLGDREPDTGNLREEAMESALAILRRFRAVIDTEMPETLDVFATAASREAPNGAGFLEEVTRIGFEPRLIPGEEESRLAGLGILCSAPEIRRERIVGIGGDLGGGSLELSLLGAGPEGVSETVSLPIGALHMRAEYGDDLKGAAKKIGKLFDELPWLRTDERSNLYVVGGSWRALARVAMHQSEHPVGILDHYTMDAEQALEVCNYVEQCSPDDLGKIDGVQKKRVPTLAMAAVTLRLLLSATDSKRVIVSACGVREGLLFDRLSEEERREEPLFALAADYAARLGAGRRPDPNAVALFTEPLFDDSASMRRVRHAAAMLIRAANMTHPDRRSEHAAAIIMTAPFLGIDHVERAALAGMMLARFGGNIEKSETVPVSLLDAEQTRYATQAGLAHRLAARLRTPMYSEESGFRLELGKERLVLNVRDDVRDFVAETAVKDLEKLASAFGVDAEIAFA